MANLFLDANYFIGLVLGRDDISKKDLDGHLLFISPLSVHILHYIGKIEVPDKNINNIVERFRVVEFSEKILGNALQGPTKDLEDNTQLHSGAEAECDCFLTNDQQILAMKFFGKMKIVNKL